MTRTSGSSAARPRSRDSSGSADAAGCRLVAIGGGSGLAVLLRGLKGHVGGALSRLTGVVTVADDGGSSGRLRRELGVLPPGDIRNCLVALADDEHLLAQLFQYRFPSGAGLSGHSFGNLFLAALTGVTGDFYQAILTAETILSVRGQILPATLADVKLRGRGRSGTLYHGESAVGDSGEPLDEVAIEPVTATGFPPAVEAIREADLIVLGPGSLYTSILPNLLIADIRAAVAASRARVVLPLNLMTQPGETDGLSAADHLAAVERSAGSGLVDVVLINRTPPPMTAVARYERSGSRPVPGRPEELTGRGIEVVAADLLAAGGLIRHDPAKLAAAVLALLPTPGHRLRPAEAAR